MFCCGACIGGGKEGNGVADGEGNGITISGGEGHIFWEIE